MDEAASGCEEAFDREVRKALPKVLGCARRLLGDEAEAWDATQEAFLRAWRKRAEFRGACLFSTWVVGIALRIGLDRLRAAGRLRGEIPENAPDAAPGPAARTEARSLGAALAEAVGALPEGERAVFLLHEEEGRRYREVADALGIPIGTVMSRLHSARTRLRARLAPWWKEERR